MTKIAVGDRVRRTVGRGFGPNAHTEGFVGEVSSIDSDEVGWVLRFPDGSGGYSTRYEIVASEGPIRTETVTTRRIEPGVYGPLEVRKESKEPMECGGKKEPVVYAYLIPTYLNASGWRDLARVALELAEFLDAQ